MFNKLSNNNIFKIEMETQIPKRVQGSIKNKIVASELVEERA